MSPDNKYQYNMACDMYVIQVKDGIRELNVYDNRKGFKRKMAPTCNSEAHSVVVGNQLGTGSWKTPS